jgi:uncharacterized protein YkwD
VPSHRAQRRAWTPLRGYLMLAVVVLLAAAAITVHVLTTGGDQGNAATAAALRSGRPSATTSAQAAPSASSASPMATRSPAPTASARSAPHPSMPAASASARPSASAQPSASASSAAATAAAASVLALINQARAQAGLPAYTVSSGLDLSASRHNQLMAAGCGLSHQCPGEAALGARETAAGVQWTAAGENIGEGGPVGGTTAAITAMAVGLTQDMLNEKPPDDGHRLNLLSSAFTHVGIAVVRSASGTVWMTQDFSN